MDNTDRNGQRLGRRRLLAGTIGSLLTAATTEGGKVMAGGKRRGTSTPGTSDGRLLARPGKPSEVVKPGLHRLGLDARRDALLFVPTTYRPEQPAPFVLSLHGAGGNEEGGLYPLQDLADEAGVVLLSPASRGRTWDVILGGYGPDIAFLDRALGAAFARVAVDPARMAVAGFSDGASYALSIGITNGDLFPHVMAFSPGFMAPTGQLGEPRIFVSHGTGDAVLPIDQTSRRVVPQLEQAGYDVRYVEFEGPHSVPPEIAREALDWFLPGPAATP